MDYPTLKEKLIMPEYGRNIQQMVEHAITIDDRDERTLCVKSIINTMGNLFPYLRDVSDFKHKLWDHLAIMSNFKLDIDFPYEVIQQENLFTSPKKIPYQNSKIRYMHYGSTLQEMIAKVSEYPDGDEKMELILLMANQMKKCFLTWNKEVVDDRKIFDDLRELSHGKIDISEDNLKLVESKDVLQKNNSNNKKRRS
ncbi:MAG: DUF4290 domain-containing protein [Paludibacter sp.]|jgi:hypothetical protein|nr:DUF4290 domain-containing protein [Paludibacter sp.]